MAWKGISMAILKELEFLEGTEVLVELRCDGLLLAAKPEFWFHDGVFD